MKMTIEGIVREAVGLRATDIHLTFGMPPSLRVGSDIVTCESDAVDASTFESLRARCNDEGHDAAAEIEGQRIRVHFFQAADRMCATLRVLYGGDIRLPDTKESAVLKRIAETRDGLVLIAGPTGSGKSFTLAQCIDHINRNYARHIVTLEDPIEFVFSPVKSLVHQRQTGRDVVSMAEGVRDALREDPDVIMLGELRDRSTLEAALHAAETGHLVFATIHTQRAVMSVNRMLSVFPAEQQEEVRCQLSQVLRAVICQRLAVIDGTFVPVRDILLNTPAVANLIRQRKEPQIISVQETSAPMQTFETAVRALRAEWGDRPELDGIIGDMS